MNLLRLNSITRLARGESALVLLASNHDPIILGPIVDEVINYPTHTNFVTAEFIEGISQKFTSYLENYPDKNSGVRNPNSAIILSVITGCLLKLAGSLGPNVESEHMPVTNSLFDWCMEQERNLVIVETKEVPLELQKSIKQIHDRETP